MSSNTVIKEEIKINVPKDKVWNVLSDLSGIQNFHPGVKKSYYVTDQKEGIGAARVCELKPMGSIKETAVEWSEGQLMSLTIESLEKAPPLKNAYGRIKLEKDGNDTVASLEMGYELKFGILGGLMNSMMVKPQFQKVVPAMLKGLKNYCEKN